MIGLDSQRPGEARGTLGDEQRAWLHQRLKSTPPLNTVLFLHHPPVAVQSPWLDAIGLQDAADFERLVRAHPQVRLIGLLMLTASVAGIQHLLFPHSGKLPDLAGGIIGVTGVGELASRFGSVGTGLILLVMTVIGSIVAADEWLLAAFGWMWHKTREHGVPAYQDPVVAPDGLARSCSVQCWPSAESQFVWQLAIAPTAMKPPFIATAAAA